jgi:L-2,4-diaminobutyrate decarboxylase
MESQFEQTSSTHVSAPALEPDGAPAERAPWLFAGSQAGLARLPSLLALTTQAALSASRAAGPLPVGSPRSVLGAASAALGPTQLPREGLGVEAALCRLSQALLEHGLDLSHPHAAAHLQPPPLSVAVVADTLASLSNASLDTYDSGPSAVAIERWLIRVLANLARLGAAADGVMTPGGSMSNLLGLLLARDAAALRRGRDVRREGACALVEPVVLCSELAHFSVHRACAALGLGERAVLDIATDDRRRMLPQALRDALRGLGPQQTPVAIVATAGTTDFGSIDPLSEIAQIAREHGVWLHVDAAYGFGALFSQRLAQLLAGVELADSITLDLHKLGWQPAAASVLLVADAGSFRALEREVAYLNPRDDSEQGLDGLLGRSLQTTRRPDAVKVAATFLAEGRRGLGALVDSCHELALYAQQRIAREPELELVAAAQLTTVVFRYRSRRWKGERALFDDRINAALRRQLLESGRALIGRTCARLEAGSAAPQRVCLKVTLLNPSATRADIDELLGAVLQAGRACESRPGEHVA